jgi:hypothetical protein
MEGTMENKEKGKIRFRDNEKPIVGIFRLKVLKNGEIIEDIEDRNLIVDGARVQMAHLIGGDVTNRQITKIAFGTSGTAPTVNDTTITDAFTKGVSGHTYPENGQVQFSWNLATTEANGMAILEFGLLSQDDTLFARRTRTNPIYKESDIALQGSWTITF